MRISSFIFSCLLLLGSTALAETHYVDINSTNPVSPYTSWETAATNIQDAVDAASSNDTVLVNDGHYLLSSEIVVTNNITIQSVTGPPTTIIDGQSSVRCFNLGNHACVVSGLIITNGYAGGYGSEGGGIYCSGTIPVVTNCVISGNEASAGGGLFGGTANDCTISYNHAIDGGGMAVGIANDCVITDNNGGYGGGLAAVTANNCTISDNSATTYGGGMNYGTASNCVIRGNSAGYSGSTTESRGGGIYNSTAYNCEITGNDADTGGGLMNSTAYNCTILENSAGSGGGLSYSTANNCTISKNKATWGGGMEGGIANNCVLNNNRGDFDGGGVFVGTVNNCNIIANSAGKRGGGIIYGYAYNCIVWYNEASTAPDIYNSTVSYSCSPDVIHGVDGNITNAPLLASLTHIAPNSAGRGAGSIDFASGRDIDGEAWLDPPSMGCDEYHGSVTGTLQVAIDCATNVVTEYSLPIFGVIQGAATRHVWNFDDGSLVTNQIFAMHAWSSPGTYALTLTAYNDNYPDGVSATQAIHVATFENATVYVAVDGDDANDGLSWAEAKATIQAGVDTQLYEGGFVWVSNGFYAVTTEVVVSKSITIQSVHGPTSTIVDGQGATRCFNLGNAACTVSGLTITNGAVSEVSEEGGGIYCAGITPIVTNCIISGNSAGSGGGICYGTAIHCTISGNSAGSGGGIREGTAIHCTISSNSASSGGGMSAGYAYNCTISGNNAMWGGGMNHCTANNSIIHGNSASSMGGGMFYGTANNCTISENSATNIGGGMAYGTVNNCVVWNNSALTGPNLHSATAYYSCSPDVSHDVDGNITNAPQFVDWMNGNYRISLSSPCINAGSNGYVSVANDLDGNPRIIDGTVDMGAYEAFYVTNSYTSASGYALEWMLAPTGWNSVVQYSINLVTMPFTDCSAPMPYPMNSYTDLVHGAEDACFYKVQIQP